MYHICIVIQFFYSKTSAMRTVNAILKQKGPHFNFIEASDTVLDAITLMKCENISYLIVFENDNYVGIISEKDYAQKVILDNKHSNTTLVKEVMTKDLPIISGEDTAEQCMLLMNASRSRYLPVFDNAVFKGVITIHDLMRETIREKGETQSIEEKFPQHYWI
jgi:signal-transduction protein with cAMP-binding, CBS, and nucleotidyltransferase domain